MSGISERVVELAYGAVYESGAAVMMISGRVLDSWAARSSSAGLDLGAGVWAEELPAIAVRSKDARPEARRENRGDKDMSKRVKSEKRGRHGIPSKCPVGMTVPFEFGKLRLGDTQQTHRHRHAGWRMDARCVRGASTNEIFRLRRVVAAGRAGDVKTDYRIHPRRFLP